LASGDTALRAPAIGVLRFRAESIVFDQAGELEDGLVYDRAYEDLARHASARVTATMYAGVADATRDTLTRRLADAGYGS
jgi:hypothetical protein